MHDLVVMSVLFLWFPLKKNSYCYVSSLSQFLSIQNIYILLIEKGLLLISILFYMIIFCFPFSSFFILQQEITMWSCLLEVLPSQYVPLLVFLVFSCSLCSQLPLPVVYLLCLRTTLFWYLHVLIHRQKPLVYILNERRSKDFVHFDDRDSAGDTRLLLQCCNMTFFFCKCRNQLFLRLKEVQCS